MLAFCLFSSVVAETENVSQCQGAGCQHGCKPGISGPLCFCRDGRQPNGTDCIGVSRSYLFLHLSPSFLRQSLEEDWLSSFSKRILRVACCPPLLPLRLIRLLFWLQLIIVQWPFLKLFLPPPLLFPFDDYTSRCRKDVQTRISLCQHPSCSG